ncbi:MAG TPA: hypothetical protein VM597_05250 [Gemmataceae bacterium]|jgi:hypothetical protein|nr:hypothetical protein [Gemmataceae bacterium]
MRRTRLLVVAFLIAAGLPGCGTFFGDRPGLCNRVKERRADQFDGAYGVPISFPGGGEGCGSTIIPPGATIVPGTGGLGTETLPPPLANGDNPRIPPAKIKESPGKQFELEKGTKGPVLTIPAIRSE